MRFFSRTKSRFRHKLSVFCVPRLKNQQPESTYQTGIILRKELGLFSVPHFVYHYHYLLQIASKNENSAKCCSPLLKDLYQVQAFLDFRDFDFRDFRFTSVYNSILFSSPLVLLSNLDLRGFCFHSFSFGYPY